MTNGIAEAEVAGWPAEHEVDRVVGIVTADRDRWRPRRPRRAPPTAAATGGLGQSAKAVAPWRCAWRSASTCCAGSAGRRERHAAGDVRPQPALGAQAAGERGHRCDVAARRQHADVGPVAAVRPALDDDEHEAQPRIDRRRRRERPSRPSRDDAIERRRGRGGAARADVARQVGDDAPAGRRRTSMAMPSDDACRGHVGEQGGKRWPRRRRRPRHRAAGAGRRRRRRACASARRRATAGRRAAGGATSESRRRRAALPGRAAAPHARR